MENTQSCSLCGLASIWWCSVRDCPDRFKHSQMRKPYATGEGQILDHALEQQQREERADAAKREAIEAYYTPTPKV